MYWEDAVGVVLSLDSSSLVPRYTTQRIERSVSPATLLQTCLSALALCLSVTVSLAFSLFVSEALFGLVRGTETIYGLNSVQCTYVYALSHKVGGEARSTYQTTVKLVPCVELTKGRKQSLQRLSMPPRA